jgi:hypothetical protein
VEKGSACVTIAIGLKVGDGIVLGADSAWTVGENVYFNAEKIINLVKGLPVGAVAYGLGTFGGRSVTRYAKDLRSRLCGADPAYAPWRVNPGDYTVAEIAHRVREFFFEELYVREYPAGTSTHSDLGFIIGGYSAGERSGEIWKITIAEGACGPPEMLFGAEQPDGIAWDGQGESLYRLLRGWSPQLVADLVDASGQPAGQVIQQVDRVASLFSAVMPIQDAIDLVRYLAEVAAGFVRFSPGLPTVAQPIDLAAITYHEGFRWVQRKHYYEPHLNVAPRESDLAYLHGEDANG